MKRLWLLALCFCACYPYLIQTPITDCGNGVVEAGEDCDPPGIGGCDDTCQTLCGNGILDIAETCDDGNNISGDGCRADCTEERCGDGVLDANESCDDGNQVDTDACRNTCEEAFCGDGVVQSGVEGCEPPNSTGCDASCQQTCTNNTDCVDTDLCTINERCENNVCVSDPLPSDDNNACTNDACDPAQGILNTPVNTNDNNACTNDTCDPATGNIAHTLLTDDNNLCTTDSCDPSIGVSHTPVVTDDNNSCTIDLCDAAQGVSHLPAGDGSVCSLANGAAGACVGQTCVANVCGDGILNAATEECDGNNFQGASCATFGLTGNLTCSQTCKTDISSCVGCGNGRIENGEECDDGNQSFNDGCSDTCQLEANLFVFCDGASTSNRDGSLENPFRTLQDAVNNASNNDIVMILPQSPQACAGANINFPILVDIQGQAIPDPSGARPTINGGIFPAIRVASFASVIVRDLVMISAIPTFGTVTVRENADLALQRVDIRNTNNIANSVGVDCDPTNGTSGGRILVDKSFLHDSPAGAMRVRDGCTGVVTNTLFQNNGTASLVSGAIRIEGIEAELDTLFSVCDGNRSTFNACLEATLLSNQNNHSFVGSIANNNNLDGGNSKNSVRTGPFVLRSNLFEQTEPANNIDANPLFFSNGSGLTGSAFHLAAGSPCINEVTSVPNTIFDANNLLGFLFFDPLSTFGINPFDEDFAGNPRKLGTASDCGIFEEQ